MHHFLTLLFIFGCADVFVNPMGFTLHQYYYRHPSRYHTVGYSVLTIVILKAPSLCCLVGKGFVLSDQVLDILLVLVS